METLHIQHDSGELTIFLDASFPSTKAWLNKLLKVIDLDSNRAELRTELEDYFHRRISDCENMLPQARKIYLGNMQKKVDVQRLVDGGKHPNGLIVKEVELKQAKKDLKEYERLVKYALSINKNLTKEKERFLKLLECL